MGGNDPSGFQSVIDNPDLVRRVTPPMCTIAKTNVDVERSHFPRGACGFSVGEVRMGRPLVYIDDRVVLGDAMVMCVCDIADCR